MIALLLGLLTMGPAAQAADIDLSLSSGGTFGNDAGLARLAGSGSTMGMGQLRVGVGLGEELAVVGSVGFGAVHTSTHDANYSQVFATALDEVDFGIGVRKGVVVGGRGALAPRVNVLAVGILGSFRMDDDPSTRHNFNQIKESGFGLGLETTAGLEVRFNPKSDKLRTGLSLDVGGRLRTPIQYGDVGAVGASGGVARMGFSVAF